MPARKLLCPGQLRSYHNSLRSYWIGVMTNRVSWLSDITYDMYISEKWYRKNNRLLPSSNFKLVDVSTEDPCWHRCWRRFLILWHTLSEWKWDLKDSCNLSIDVKSPFSFHKAFVCPPSHSFTNITCKHINRGSEW